MNKETKLASPDKLRSFYHLLINSLVASTMNFTVWFAITFYVYLQTKSVFATGIISGIFLVITALTSFWFGSLVDHNKKKKVMMWSSIVSLVAYLVSFVIYIMGGQETFKDPAA